MERKYYAHYRKENHTYQTLEEHIRNTARLSREYCSIDLLKKAAWLAGFYHDIGKGRNEWQEYFERAIADEKRKSGEKIDHSTLGGILAEKAMPNSLLAEMIETAIYNHHGISDSVSVQDGAARIWKRRNKYNLSDESELNASLLLRTYAGDIRLEEYWKKARIDLDELGKQIFTLA